MTATANDAETDPGSGEIAVVGMAGRFPGGGGLADFWAGLAEGRESLTRFPLDGDAGQERVRGVVPGADRFDTDFFGYSPNEALLIDPQHRAFLECAWEALEHAGHDPRGGAGPVGVYAGCGDTGHLESLRAHRSRFPEVTELQLRLASSADFLTSRIAYKLGLTGPALTVQTACSTSLVAVHTAVQSLLAGECDTALAGGVTLHASSAHQDQDEEDIVAGDGHCRAFDAQASGTVPADGAGVVVLKRLEDAVADGDTVYAVVRGSAVTNDGAGKVGFTAPSVQGQASAVRAACLVAGVEPAEIDYVEAHGTGTLVGDPIEVRALTRAFTEDVPEPPEPGSVLLGSLKTNIGHTDAAAGVLGLIKVVLALREELIPASLHFRTPNPDAALEDSPFRVAAQPVKWPRGSRPRRAGVNSVGLGGTNAHVIVEEAPATGEDSRAPAWEHQVLPLSARSPAALGRAADRLAAQLAAEPQGELADVAYTLQTGRHAFPYRAFVVAGDRIDAARALAGDEPGRLITATGPAPGEPRETVFLFPGQGAQHVGMARELYRRHTGFRADVDACAELAAPRLGTDLREVLFPDDVPDAVARAERLLATMAIGQPAVFAVEYALARLWQAWGVRPAAVLGHSLGAYAAAAIAGVLSLPDAMTLVLARGHLLGTVDSGAMLAVPLSADEVGPHLGDALSLAAVNGPGQCVLAGHADAVRGVRDALAAQGVDGHLLHISTAAHSHLVEPLLPAYERHVAGVRPRPPEVRWISDRTGEPVGAQEVTEPGFWSGHLRHTVDFHAALGTVLAGGAALLEVGPGRTLTGLARRHPAFGDGRPAVPCMPHPADEADGAAVLFAAAGTLWQAGVGVDWEAVHAGARTPRRVPLPTYPFERRTFRLDQAPGQEPGTGTAPPPTVREPATGPEPAGSWATETEAIVAAAFRSILGVRRPDGHRSFFELGGDSMLASRVAAVLRRELDLPVSVRTVFTAPTIVTLAGALDKLKVART